MFFCEFFNLVVVKFAGFCVDGILYGFEYSACYADFPTVGEMSAVGKRQAHDCVARLGQGQICGPVGNRTGVGLDICILGFEQFFRPLLSHPLNQVGYLLAFVVSSAGVTFGIFIGQAASAGLHHGSGYVVFRRDESNRAALARPFLSYKFVNLGVIMFEGRYHIGFSLDYSA